MRNISPLLFCLISLLFTACESEKSIKEELSLSFNQSELLANLSDGLIRPHYEALREKSSFLKGSVEAFVLAPDSIKLEDARMHLFDTYMAWQQVNMYDFGPALAADLKGNVNVFPTDSTALKLASSQGNTNWNALANKTIKGFPAMDYLLNHASTATVLSEFQSSSRAQFFFNMVVDLDTRINLVSTEWQSYQAFFKGNTGTSIGSSVGMLTNAFNQHFERYLRDGKLGIPIGVRSSGLARPQDSEAFFGAHSFALLKSNFSAIQELYLGGAGIGYDDYLLAADASALDAAIKTQLYIVSSKINSFSGSLSDAILSRPAELQSLYLEMQKLIVLWKVDLPSRLGILITYQDNDGD